MVRRADGGGTESWRQRIAPLDGAIIAPGRERGLPCSLHSCGFFRAVIDDFLVVLRRVEGNDDWRLTIPKIRCRAP